MARRGRAGGLCKQTLRRSLELSDDGFELDQDLVVCLATIYFEILNHDH